MPRVKREALNRITIAMLEHCAQCARRGPHGEWIITPGEPRHDHRPGGPTMDEVMQGAQFLGDLARACGAAGLPSPFDDPDPEEMNLRPVDPAWLALTDKLAEEAARQLNAYTVLVAVQDGGKMGITAGGEDLPGDEVKEVKEMAKDMPAFLRLLADVVERGATKHGKHADAPAEPVERELHFMPGCFDDFPGTPEQLAEFKAQLHQMVASGELQRGARLLTPEEVEELREQLRERDAKRGPLQ